MIASMNAVLAYSCVFAIALSGSISLAQAPPASENVFPILPWETPRFKEKQLSDREHGIASMAEAGFTVAAFPVSDQLPLCEKSNLRAIVSLPGEQIEWGKLSDEQIVETVKKLVGSTKDDPHVVGYFLRDEPGAKMFPALGKAVAAVKKLAPGKLAYINLLPNYATLGATDLSQLGTASYGEYLERYVAEVKPQFLSYDNYKIEFSDDLKNPAQAESYFTNLMQVRDVALKHNLPWWNIVTSNQIRPKTTPPSPANLLLQAYTTLAAGARGLTWFTYYNRPLPSTKRGYEYAPIDDDGHRSVTWSYLRMVNEQVKVLGPIMNQLTSTGVFFTSPAPAKNLPALPGRLIESIVADSPVMVAEFSSRNGVDYVMLVNLNLASSSKLTIKPHQPSAKMESISPVDASASPLANDNAIWLTAGQGVLLRFGGSEKR